MPVERWIPVAIIVAGVVAGLLGVNRLPILAFEAGAGLVYGLLVPSKVVPRLLPSGTVVGRLLSGTVGAVAFPALTMLLLVLARVLALLAKALLALLIILALALALYYVISKLYHGPSGDRR